MTLLVEEEDLQTWANANEPKETLYYAQGYWEQICFIRDDIRYLFPDAKATVVSTHYSKSITLPVYRLQLTSHVYMYLRHNFHDWIISVISDAALQLRLRHFPYINTKERVHPTVCGGFKSAWIFPSYEENSRTFTISINNTYDLHAFLLEIRRQGES